MRTEREFRTSTRLPDFPGESIVTRTNLPADNNQATAVSEERMRRAAIDDSQHPVVRRALAQALAGVPGDRLAQVRALWPWIRSHVKLRQDGPALLALLDLEDEIDLFIRPARLLTMTLPAEDCDGFSMLTCSMLLAAGVPCEFVTIAYDHADPSRWSHVYCNAILEDGTRYPMDCSHGDAPGIEPPDFYRKKVWPVMTPMNKRSGLNGYGPGPRGLGDDIDWSSILNTAVGGGVQIAKQLSMQPGQYIQTPQGIMSTAGLPMSTAFQNPLAGISSNTLLLVGGGLVLVLLLARK